MRWSILFLCLIVISIFWFWFWFGALAVAGTYHPMAQRGDLYAPLRFVALVTIPSVGLIIGCLRLWYWKSGLTPRVYIGGAALVAVAMLVQLLPQVDSGYRQTYWLGETRHEIPWQYSPYNGDPDPGGLSFLAEVSFPDLVPRYASQDQTVIIGKAVDFNFGRGYRGPDDLCSKYLSLIGNEWKRGEFVYKISGPTELLPKDYIQLTNSVADLLDSFETPGAPLSPN